MSSPKEPQFFSFDERFERGAYAHNSIFDKRAGSRYFGESSQCYFAHPWAIERITGNLAEPKAIIMLRDPIDRLFSQYRWNYKRGTETDSLVDAIATRGDEVGYIFDARIDMYRERGGYVAFSRYSKWVPLWEEALGTNNVLVVKFEDFVRDEAGTLLRCFSFLGVREFEFASSAPKNTTDETMLDIVPSNYRAISRLIPGTIKAFPMYARLKKRMLGRLTPEPVSRIDGPLQRHLEGVLREDIRFFEDLG